MERFSSVRDIIQSNRRSYQHKLLAFNFKKLRVHAHSVSASARTFADVSLSLAPSCRSVIERQSRVYVRCRSFHVNLMCIHKYLSVNVGRN